MMELVHDGDFHLCLRTVRRFTLDELRSKRTIIDLLNTFVYITKATPKRISVRGMLNLLL